MSSLSRYLLLAATCSVIDSIAPWIRAQQQEGIRHPVELAAQPALSPDGSTLAFEWGGDIWTARTSGGRALRLTVHPARDSQPVFSPDGQRIAFSSDREGSTQTYVMPASGGAARQVTFHSEGATPVDWYPDGRYLMVQGSRDARTRVTSRLFRIDTTERHAERLLFDAECLSANLSHDGKSVLFTREDTSLYRIGYHGSQASQIWRADAIGTASPVYQEICRDEWGCRFPLWKPDGTGLYHVSAKGTGVFNLWERDFVTGKDQRLTNYTDQMVMFPSLSADGKWLVFRKGLDFYRYDTKKRTPPERLDLWATPEDVSPDEIRRVLGRATNVTFSADGLEVAFITGGNLWVMDTVLREPRRVTATESADDEPIFVNKDQEILFLRDTGNGVDLWRATRLNPALYWWQNEGFKVERLTTDGQEKSNLTPSPEGSKIAWVQGLGTLQVAGLDAREPKSVLATWNAPDYTWSPDGRWMGVAVEDSDHNSDVWIYSVEGKVPPYNVSRHPDVDGNPKWSPDGKVLAFTSRRRDDETDLYYVWLRDEDDQIRSRELKLKETLAAFTAARKKPAAIQPPTTPEPPEIKPSASPASTPPPVNPPPAPSKDAEAKVPEAVAKAPVKPTSPPAEKKAPEPLRIDFDGLYERIRRIPLKDTEESLPFWSPDSKKLAFQGSIKGQDGTWTVSFPEPKTPTLLSNTKGGLARWIARDDTVLWLVNGVPSSLSRGASKSFSFSVRQEVSRRAQQALGFRIAWRTIRDHWYDASLNGLDWNAVLQRYESAAGRAVDGAVFDRIVEMMFGELNGSHLGFLPGTFFGNPPVVPWRDETAHLGLVFDPFHEGAGWLVTHAIDRSPADRHDADLRPGDLILAVDGTVVTSEMDPTEVLNGDLNREIVLRIRRGQDQPVEKRLRPISYADARRLRHEEDVRENHRRVEKVSGGKIGYVHVAHMQWPDFEQFEEEIHARGAGKDGLIIDVRDNGGGFTADHLLTVLCQPRHAWTVPRGGSPGYPGDRRVYASWDKPIVVLCNQNSFSNAEIFTHAIKTLQRGKVVGVPTAGGVVSTGSASILDIGMMRMPTRGWYTLKEGEDMELHPAVPDVVLWPAPGELPRGGDRQLDKAIAVLQSELKTSGALSPPELHPASTRRAKP